MVTSSYTMVEDYSPISHLPSHQSSHLPTHCKSQSQGYISHSPAYISHTPSSLSSCKRKLPNEFDSYPASPPKQRIFSMMYNTPKQHRDESKQMLRISVKKLRAIDNPETNLCRSVLINNAVKRLRKDIKEEKRNGFQKTRFSQHYSMDYETCDRTSDKCDRTGDKCDMTSDVTDMFCDAKDNSDILSDTCDVTDNDVENVSCERISHQDDDDHSKYSSISQLIYRPRTSQSASQPMSYSTYHSTLQNTHFSPQSLPISPSTPLSHTVSDFAHIVQADPQPTPESARCPGYDVTRDTMMSYPDPVVMDTSDSEEFIDIMTVDDENTPLDLSVANVRTEASQDTYTNYDTTSFADRVCAERVFAESSDSKPNQDTSHATNESLLTDRDRLILSDMEAVFNKIMSVITDSCHGANLSHEIPTFISEIPTITSSS